MDYEFIQTEVKGRVGIVTLNRPKQMNALNAKLMQELGAALYAFDADDAIGCMIVTGSEKAFAAGADIVAMKDWQFIDVYKANYITRDWEHLRNIRKPVIGAVAGYALGGGNELAMMCDIVIAADNANFGQPEVNLGILPGAGGTQRLPRGRQGEGDGPLPHRAHDGRARSRALRAGIARRAARQVDGGGARRRREDRLLLDAGGDDDQGIGECRVRDAARRRGALRAPPVPRRVRARRPERGHGGVRREAQTCVQEPLRGD
jgi:hypothetical protein